MDFSRRNFLKIAVGSAAATGIASAARQAERVPYVVPPEEALPGEATWYASTCGECQAGCGLLARVINGRPRKLEGNPRHPLNRGKLCTRGQAGLNVLYDPDRLKNAVRQSGGRNSRKFDAIPWDEALSQIFDAIDTIGDPQRIAFLGGDTPDHLASLVGLFMDSLGGRPPLYFDLLSTLEGRGHLRDLSERWFDSRELPAFDIAQADVIFSFGANFLETWLSPVSQSVDFGLMRQGARGGRGFLAQFEPRLSSTAASADEWIPTRPGTEGLVALALGRIIVEENLGNVGSHRPFAGLYRGQEVGSLAEAAGVPAERLFQLARFFAEADRPLALPGGQLSGLTNGTQAMDAVMSLNVLMRRIGREGGVFLPQPVPATSIPGAKTQATFTELIDLINAMRRGQVDLLFIHGSNPLFELPTWVRFLEGMRSVPLVVSFSSVVNETALWADLVLPDHTSLESWGYQIPAPGADRPCISQYQPVASPLYDTRATADVFLTLASSLGGRTAQALPWSNEVEYLEQTSAELFDSSIGQFDARTPSGFWSRWRQFGGWWSEKSIRQEPILKHPLDEALSMPEARFAGVEGRYPYHLLPYPSISLSDGRGANSPLLQEIPDPVTTARWGTWIEINPDTAHMLGLEDNEIVRLVSPHGEVEVPVVIFPGIRPDTVAMPVGQGHTQLGRFADDRGAWIMSLIAPFAATAQVRLLWASTRVSIEKTNRVHQVARLESIEGEGRESIR
jgi:anaerobic selenocysteine-containing dehydrogenase